MIIANQTVALEIIRKSVNEFFPDSSVFLFGSRARADFDEDSDYDLLIVTDAEQDTKKRRLIKAMIRKRLAQNKIPADIIIQSNAELEVNKKITGHIVRQVLMEGIRL